MYVPINNIFHATSKATPLENGIDLKISRIIPPKVNEMNKQKSITRIDNPLKIFVYSLASRIVSFFKACSFFAIILFAIGDTRSTNKVASK